MAVIVNGTEITLTGDVGDMWWGDFFSHANVIQALAEVGRDVDITVRINSGGGIATEGAAIHAALSQHKGSIHMIVEGWAASAASLIAMAGDRVTMSKGAVLMIHDPAGTSWGPAAQLRKDADVLDVLGDSYAGIYADKCGTDPAGVRDIMRAETWYRPEEAVKAGFADDTSEQESPEPVAFRGVVAYAHAPERIRALAQSRGWTARVSMAALPAAAPRQQEKSMTEKPEAGKEAPAVIQPAAPVIDAPADPGAIAKACHTAGHPELTASLLDGKATMATVTSRIEEAKAIAQAATLAGAPSMGSKLIAAGVSLEVARDLLAEARASKDEAIVTDTAHNNANPGAKQKAKAAMIDHKAIYNRMNGIKE